MADSLEKYVGKYFSQEYIRRFIFKQSEKEIKDMDKQIKAEGPYEPTGMDTSLGTTPNKSETII